MSKKSDLIGKPTSCLRVGLSKRWVELLIWIGDILLFKNGLSSYSLDFLNRILKKNIIQS